VFPFDYADAVQDNINEVNTVPAQMQGNAEALK
jgi:hypothetical protein